MQIDAMVNYFSLHSYVANNKFQGMLGKKRLEGSWEELTDMLNVMFNNGKNKSVNSWKTVGLYMSAAILLFPSILNYDNINYFTADMVRY